MCSVDTLPVYFDMSRVCNRFILSFHERLRYINKSQSEYKAKSRKSQENGLIVNARQKRFHIFISSVSCYAFSKTMTIGDGDGIGVLYFCWSSLLVCV